MKVRNGNGYAALVLLSTVALIIIAYIIVVPIFAQLYDRFYDDTDFSAGKTEESCAGRGYWYDAECHQLPERGKTLFENIRSMWLFAPVIFIISMLVWFFTTVFRKDPQQYMR